MVPTIVFSFYGMNLKLPWKDAQMTPYVMILISIAIAFGMIALVRRSGKL